MRPNLDLDQQPVSFAHHVDRPITAARLLSPITEDAILNDAARDDGPDDIVLIAATSVLLQDDAYAGNVLHPVESRLFPLQFFEDRSCIF